MMRNAPVVCAAENNDVLLAVDGFIARIGVDLCSRSPEHHVEHVCKSDFG